MHPRSSLLGSRYLLHSARLRRLDDIQSSDMEKQRQVRAVVFQRWWLFVWNWLTSPSRTAGVGQLGNGSTKDILLLYIIYIIHIYGVDVFSLQKKEVLPVTHV